MKNGVFSFRSVPYLQIGNQFMQLLGGLFDDENDPFFGLAAGPQLGDVALLSSRRQELEINYDLVGNVFGVMSPCRELDGAGLESVGGTFA